MLNISLRELLEAGCHFGHQVSRWNPKASDFIYTDREGIHIIDLAKTKKGLEQAYEFLKTTAENGKTIMFIGTKRQARVFIKEEAIRCGVFYINERWVGGLLTNWDEVKKNLDKIRNLEKIIVNEDGTYTKAEVGKFKLQLVRLLHLYEGIKELNSVPDAIFVLDIKKEVNCVLEARKKEIKVVGVVDTNSDPDMVDFAIPANDDAVGSIKLLIKLMADAVEEGKKVWEKKKASEEKKMEKTKQKESKSNSSHTSN